MRFLMPRLATAGMLVAVLSSTSSAEQNVPDWANDSLLEEIVISVDGPTSVPELTGLSDVIVEGTVVAQRSFLDRDGSRIWTDYRMQITRALRIRDGRDVEAMLTVRRRGGTLPFGNRSVVSNENDFQPFQLGEQFVLFLRKTGVPGVYTIAAGHSGATRIADGLAGTMPLVKYRETVLQYAQLPVASAQGAK